MRVIIYKTNAGSTARYAKLLAHELNLPVYSIDEARKKYLPMRRSSILAG